MRLLNRFFGKPTDRLAAEPGTAQPAHPQELIPSQKAAPHAIQWTAYFVVSESRMSVVGESHYQPALREAVKGQSSEDGIEVEACIVREPANKYDHNAVRIDVGGKTVGYISRDEAPLLGRRLAELESRGMRPTCRARVFGGSRHKPSYGIVLHAGHALTGLANTLPASDHVRLEGSWMTSVSGEEHHQDVLEPYASADHESLVHVFVTLHPCEIVSGKYAGQQALEVRVDGQRVGQLTRAMTERYWPDVEAALAADRIVVAEAVLRREEKIEVYVLMPAHK